MTKSEDYLLKDENLKLIKEKNIARINAGKNSRYRTKVKKGKSNKI